MDISLDSDIGRIAQVRASDITKYVRFLVENGVSKMPSDTGMVFTYHISPISFFDLALLKFRVCKTAFSVFPSVGYHRVSFGHTRGFSRCMGAGGLFLLCSFTGLIMCLRRCCYTGCMLTLHNHGQSVFDACQHIESYPDPLLNISSPRREYAHASRS